MNLRILVILLVQFAACQLILAQAEPRLLTDAAPGIESFNPDWGVRRVGGDFPGATKDDPLVYFAGLSQFESPGELWRTDGTHEGTFLVWKENEGGNCLNDAMRNSWRKQFLQIESSLFFLVGPTLWFTEGTRKSTMLLLESILIDEFSPTIVAGRLFFFADDPFHGRELWVSDGTPAGTHLVADLTPGTEGTNFCITGALGAQFLFETCGVFGAGTLWVSDGTINGTRTVAELPVFSAFLGGTDDYALLLTHSTRERSYWVTDGTSQGTHPIWSGARPTLGEGSTHKLGNQFVTALNYQDEAIGKHQVWVMNYGEAILLEESAGVVQDFRPIVVNGNLFYFVGAVLWVTDGTSSGTRPLGSFVQPSQGNAVPLRGSILFSADDPVLRCPQLWISDGTSAGTHVIDVRLPPKDDTHCGCPPFFEIFGVIGDRAYLLMHCALSPATPLWSTDGTASGTMPVYLGGAVGERPFIGITVDPSESACGDDYYFPAAIWPRKGLLLFAGYDDIHGSEPWALPLDQPTRTLFHRGDPNASGTTDISDGVTIFSHLFLGNPVTLACQESGDANNDGTIDISDGIYLLSWLFTGGSAPAVPGPPGNLCGLDPDQEGSKSDLGCSVYTPCG